MCYWYLQVIEDMTVHANVPALAMEEVCHFEEQFSDGALQKIRYYYMWLNTPKKKSCISRAKVQILKF
jgi:hypothetical protein